jgi:hypothetical protein
VGICNTEPSDCRYQAVVSLKGDSPGSRAGTWGGCLPTIRAETDQKGVSFRPAKRVNYRPALTVRASRVARGSPEGRWRHRWRARERVIGRRPIGFGLPWTFGPANDSGLRNRPWSGHEAQSADYRGRAPRIPVRTTFAWPTPRPGTSQDSLPPHREAECGPSHAEASRTLARPPRTLPV